MYLEPTEGDVGIVFKRTDLKKITTLKLTSKTFHQRDFVQRLKMNLAYLYLLLNI